MIMSLSSKSSSESSSSIGACCMAAGADTNGVASLRTPVSLRKLVAGAAAVAAMFCDAGIGLLGSLCGLMSGAETVVKLGCDVLIE